MPVQDQKLPVHFVPISAACSMHFPKCRGDACTLV